MANAMTVSVLAAMSALGAVAGTQLGQDAVAQINPIFFTELPESHYIEDTPEPFRLGTPDPIPSDASWPNAYIVGRRPVCIDCPTNFVDPLYAAAQPASATRVRTIEDDAPPEFERSLSSRELDRYMSYPVSEQEIVPVTDRDAYAAKEAPQSESSEKAAQPVGM